MKTVKFTLFVGIFLFCRPAFAYEKYQNWCQQGNQAVSTGGLNSSTKVQRSFVSCTITVFNAGTVTKATLYSDANGTPLANPFTICSSSCSETTNTAQYFLFADNGYYDIQIVSTGLTTYTLSKVPIGGAGGTTINCNSFQGVNGAARMANCMNSLPSGGIADARNGFEGDQYATANMWVGITKPITLLTGATTLHSTVTQRPASSNSTWEGYGTTLSFEPIAPFVGGINDRAIWVTPDSSTILGPYNAAAPSINAGATSFNAANAADVASLVANDWLMLYQIDSVVGDVVIFDWMQVSGVSGTTVSTYAPFRTTFLAVGSGGHATTQFNIVHAANVLQNVSIRGITCTTTDAVNAFPCFASGYSRNVAFDHVVSNPKLGNALYSYRTAGLKFTNSTQLSDQTQASEIAESVDTIITGNTFKILNAVPNTSALTLDLGTGYFSVAHNIFYPCGNICVQIAYGVHDGQFVDNSIGYVYSATNGQGVVAIGAQHINFSHNNLIGSMGGASTGVIFSSTSGLIVDIVSKGNVIGPNIINGFTSKYGARLTTDLYIVTYDTNDFEINGAFDVENVSNQTAFQTHITGETVQRFIITTNGLVTWTDAGVSGSDFTLSRGSSGVAEFSKNLKVDGYNISSKGILTLVNGANNNIALGGIEYAQIAGPAGGFSVTGFAAGVEGRKLYLFNSVAQQLTIANENVGSAATSRITTLTGADVVLRAGTSFASFIYDGGNNRWVLMATN